MIYIRKHRGILLTSYSPSVRTVITLLSIPSPRAFFPTTWNSYVVPDESLFIVTWVLPGGVTGMVDQSDTPASLYLQYKQKYRLQFEDIFCRNDLCNFCFVSCHTFHEKPFRSLKFGAWCGVSQQTMIGSIFFRQKVTAEHYCELLVFINFVSLLEVDE